MNALAAAQDRMGAGQFVGRRPNVHARIVQDEIFDVDEFALDPGTGAGVQEMRPGDPALANRTYAQPLVQPRQRVFGGAQRSRD